MAATLNKKSGIYEIRCLGNNKSYIGSASNLVSRRYSHFYNLRRGTHCNRFLQNAWNKYGEDTFVFTILKICSVKQLVKWEQIYIDKFEAFGKGFNLCPEAGRNSGLRFSEKTKRKMSKDRKGRKHSEESKRRISKSNKGRECSEETKKKIGKASRRHRHSEKAKRKMSISAKRRPRCTEETRRKISVLSKGNINMLGKYHSEESKKKISESLKGRICSEETRRKISESNKGQTRSKVTKKNNSNAQKGKNLSEKHKKKISKSIRKWWNIKEKQNARVA